MHGVLNVCLCGLLSDLRRMIIGYQNEDEETYNIDWKGSAGYIKPKAVGLSDIFITIHIAFSSNYYNLIIIFPTVSINLVNVKM